MDTLWISIGYGISPVHPSFHCLMLFLSTEPDQLGHAMKSIQNSFVSICWQGDWIF
jgi:hypothetical protein